MVMDRHPKQFFNRCFDGLYSRVAEFDYFTSVCANHVVVLLGTVRFFKLRDVFSKLMLPHKIAGQEQLYCVV